MIFIFPKYEADQIDQSKVLTIFGFEKQLLPVKMTKNEGIFLIVLIFFHFL